MQNFTYLIGAGASAKTIPLVKDFYKELIDFIDVHEHFKFKSDEFITKGIYDSINPSGILNMFIDTAKWAAKGCLNHSSVDTFARKLYLKGNKTELQKLKSIVSEFLFFKQIQNGVDLRYDTFFATLLEKDEEDNLVLPPNIKILSWNYDKQIEHSIASFNKNDGSSYVEDFLNLIPRRNHTKVKNSEFSLIKINGTVGGLIDNEDYIPLRINYKDSELLRNSKSKWEEILKEMLERYKLVEFDASMVEDSKYESQRNTSILYAWEKDSLVNDIRENAIQVAQKTDYLIIIGYSFPNFNREVDKSILESMDRLEKVFIQTTPEAIEGVTQRFKSLFGKEINIIPITNTEEFYIPFEY